MRIAAFVVRRLLFAAPQIIAITVITFFIIRLLPGDPAAVLAGSYATPSSVASIRHQLGLDKPIWDQYLRYLDHLVHGDLGTSWFSSSSIGHELAVRVPATLELITCALVVIVVGGIGGGLLLGATKGRFQKRTVGVYGYFAGSFPDFYLGLVLSFVFFFKLGWLPSPFGRLGQGFIAPPKVTGLYTVDATLAGQWGTLGDAVKHLILPVLTLALVYAAPVLKLSSVMIDQMMNSEFCRYARACGLPRRVIARYALRNSLPPVVTLVGFTYGFLLGGAVLVETIFSWGGVGEYVVQSGNNADYFPVQAVVLLAAVFNLVVYLIVDVVHFTIDPRVNL
jgi:ABC-type dipeptide/oligopeptide/nickel transport system permease component